MVAVQTGLQICNFFTSEIYFSKVLKKSVPIFVGPASKSLTLSGHMHTLVTLKHYKLSPHVHKHFGRNTQPFLLALLFTTDYTTPSVHLYVTSISSILSQLASYINERRQYLNQHTLHSFVIFNVNFVKVGFKLQHQNLTRTTANSSEILGSMVPNRWSSLATLTSPGSQAGERQLKLPRSGVMVDGPI